MKDLQSRCIVGKIGIEPTTSEETRATIWRQTNTTNMPIYTYLIFKGQSRVFNSTLVGIVGLEPTTFCSRGKRPSQLDDIPIITFLFFLLSLYVPIFQSLDNAEKPAGEFSLLVSF